MGASQNANYLTGKLLIAMPQLSDPRFAKAVIFMCAHDKNGAMGLVINNTLNDVKFSDLLDQLNITSDIHIDLKSLSIPVMGGGPVEVSRGFLLHSGDFEKQDTMKLNNNFAITGTIDALKAVAEGEGPKDKLFILGYAGWTKGQLEKEIQENSWLVVEPDEAIIYHEQPKEKWMMAMNKLGLDNPAMLSGEAGRA